MSKKASLLGAAGLYLVKHNLKSPEFLLPTAVSTLQGGPSIGAATAVNNFGLGKLNLENIKKVQEKKTFNKKNPGQIQFMNMIDKNNTNKIPSI